MTIDNIEYSAKDVKLYCDGGGIEVTIPKRGDELDVIRTKFNITKSKKYTKHDIHALQILIFKELGVNVSSIEVE
jgi:hypothetical protein